jgi:hypothetical protein
MRRLIMPNFFPKNLNRENAYPDIEARTTPVTVTVREIIALFLIHRRNG